MAVPAAHAQDEPLPDAVAQAYLAYEAARAREDYRAASTAAEQAFAAARESNLPADLRLTLGLNAIAMAPTRGTGSGLIELTRATAALADGLGDRDAGFDAWLGGIVAATRSGDLVALHTLGVDQMAWLVAVEYRDLSGLAELPLMPPPYVFSAEQSALAQHNFDLAQALGDPIAIANAVLTLYVDATARQDWEAALALLQTGLRASSGAEAADEFARRALLTRIADVLRDGYADTSSGEARLAPDIVGLWCEHLSGQPIPVDRRMETRVPMTAATRSQTAIVMTPFSVPAAGGLPRLGETDASYWGSQSLRRASRVHLEQTVFRPACAGSVGEVSGIEFEGFYMLPIQYARGGGAVLQYRTLLGFTSAD